MSLLLFSRIQGIQQRDKIPCSPHNQDQVDFRYHEEHLLKLRNISILFRSHSQQIRRTKVSKFQNDQKVVFNQRSQAIRKIQLM